MAEYIFDGEPIHKAHTNRHHLIFPERDFKTPTEKRFRGLSGFLIRMTVISHRELHEAVKPPRRPSKNLMSEIIRFQDPYMNDDEMVKLNRTIDYLDNLANPEREGYEGNLEAEDLMDNLMQQRVYVELGRVTLLEDL